MAEMNDSTLLHGHEAIEFAAATGRALNKYSDPLEEARAGITIEEAREIAVIDPSLIWIAQ